jgi:hypothetical protein
MPVVFVVTHEQREPMPMKGGTTYTFVSTGIDELQIHVVPVLLGGGVRPFEQSRLEPPKLAKREALETRGATHLRLAVPR